MKKPSSHILIGWAAILVLAMLPFMPLRIVLDGAGAFNSRTAPKRDSVLSVGLLSDPGTLNPLFASSTQARDIIERIFLKLLDEKDDFIHFSPRLAKSWQFSDDSLSITFFLRDDVRWQDGEPFTAEDVRFTWECEVDTIISWSGRHLKERITDVEVIDDYAVTFHFSDRYPYQLMDANDGVILPEHILRDVPREKFRTCPFSRRPVGNGPYRLDSWSSKQYVQLERNPDYYERGKPGIDRIVFKIVPDMVTLYSQLKSGEIDCLESVSPDEVENLQENYKNIRIYKYPSRSMTFISWNLQNELFKSRYIRRALTMAINRRAIIENIWRGMAMECTSPMHPILWAFDRSIKAIPYNPGYASKILSANGWEDRNGDGVIDKNGVPFSFEMITNYGNEQRADVVTMVQAQLSDVGIKVKPRILEWNTFVDKIIKAEYESCVMGWKVGTRADLAEFWHSASTGRKGFNISGYNNKEVDRLIEEARSTFSFKKAARLWSECQRIIYEDQPFVFLAVPYEVTALSKKFYDVRPSPISFFNNLRDWKIDPSFDR